mgnify:CR=1 FL=1
MNRKKKKKVIDELATENPRLDYVRGVLETLLDSLSADNLTITSTPSTLIFNNKTSPPEAIDIPPPPASLNGLFLDNVKTEN